MHVEVASASGYVLCAEACLIRGAGLLGVSRVLMPALVSKLCTQIRLSTQALNQKGKYVSTMKTKDGVEQFPRRGAAARLECHSLAATALLLAGIGFWQHYTGYVEAEQRGDVVASVQTAPESASGSTTAERRPNMAETIEHANIHPQVSDISSVTVDIGLSNHRPRTASAVPVLQEQHPPNTSMPWLVP